MYFRQRSGGPFASIQWFPVIASRGAPMMPGPAQRNAAEAASCVRLQILIVSPVRLLRDGLAALLRERPNVQSVEAAESTELAVQALERFTPTLILLDVAT